MTTTKRQHLTVTCTDTSGQTHSLQMFGHPTTRARDFARRCFRSQGVDVARGSVKVEVSVA